MSRQFTGPLTEEDEKFLKQRKSIQQVEYLKETSPLVEDEVEVEVEDEVDPAAAEAKEAADASVEEKPTSAKK